MCLGIYAKICLPRIKSIEKPPFFVGGVLCKQLRINAIVECNSQPLFAQSVRRGDDWKYSIQSGEFYNKFQRIINICKNYNDLYYDNQQADFIKQPIYVFIGEDVDHCKDIFDSIKKFIYQGSTEPIIDVWFCCDLKVYNDFLKSHFTFDKNGEYMGINLFSMLQIPESPGTLDTNENVDAIEEAGELIIS